MNSFLHTKAAEQSSLHRADNRKTTGGGTEGTDANSGGGGTPATFPRALKDKLEASPSLYESKSVLPSMIRNKGGEMS